MGSGELIALGSAVVAAVALAVSGFAYRLQREAQGRTDEQQLNDLIEKLQDGLASFNRPQGSFTIEAYATNATALVGLHGHAIAARKLIERSGIEPDWFQSMVLAVAFTQAWDVASAIDYWGRAVEVSKPEHQAPGHKPHYQAYFRSLAARAEFYYNRGRKNGRQDDWQLARDDYETVVRELLKDPDGQGLDQSRQQAASVLVYQAGFELNMVGDDARAIACISEAFVQANSVVVPWRRHRALESIASFVSILQQQMLQPRDLLTPIVAELARREVDIDKFPASVVALLTLPPDGGSGGAAGQSAELYGAAS
jgi:tetratricopeptide (TPR) repeat protein